MALVNFFLLCVALSLFLEVFCKGHHKDKRLSFFAVGDFGGTDLFPFYTYTQKRVAQTMGKVSVNGLSKYIDFLVHKTQGFIEAI